MVFDVVEKNVDQPLGGVHDHNRHQKGDGALCVDGEHFQHFGFAGLQINGAMDVEAITTAGLGDGNFGAFRRPASGRGALRASGIRRRRT
jgi:hypothetical protein